MELKITNNSKITIVNGYSKKIILRFSNEELIAVSKVYFVCDKLAICQEMQQIGNDFVLLLKAEETALFETPLLTDYNFNIIYNEVDIKGGFNGGILEVKINKNPTTCEV